LGFASALGLGGLSWTHHFNESIGLELGAGFGFTGAQLSVMPKFSFGSEQHRFVFGIGPSVGLGGITGRDGGIPFLNVDAIGYTYRARNGFTFSVGAGLTIALGGTYDIDGGPEKAAGIVMPQMRIGFGYRF
jgi:hypothetical protein